MIRPILALSLRIGPGSRAAVVLPITAFAIVTALLLGLIGGAQTFWSFTDDVSMVYQMLAGIALALLVVPLTSLAGAAARLSARRRDERLSTLRLLGVPARTVQTVTVIESAGLALLGATVGAALSFLVLPLIALIPFRGEALGFVAVVPAWWVFLAVIAGVTLLAAVSSVLSLQAVVISPLGVRTRQNAPSLSWVRALIAVVVIGVAFVAVTISTTGALAPTIIMLVLAGCFGGALAVLNLIGPWFLALRARAQARKARTAERLIAARRVTEDPRAAWRQVSGVAMASFMAVFAGSGVSLLAQVSASDATSAGDPAAFLIPDMQTGVLITVIGSFLIVACAVGVSQAADILDRRDLARSLAMLGADISTIDASRKRSVMAPLITVSLASALIAAILLFPLVGLTLIVSPLTLVVIGAVLALGCLVVWLGLGATTPMQRAAALPA